MAQPPRRETGRDPQRDDDARRLLPDGGERTEDEDDEDDPDLDTSNVEILEEGEAEPAEPRWEMPDIDDDSDYDDDPASESTEPTSGNNDPASGPTDPTGGATEPGAADPTEASGVDGSPFDSAETESDDDKWAEPNLDELDDFEIRADDPPLKGVGHRDVPDGEENPTAGMPNTAGAPGTRIKEGSADAYIASLELCVHLPDEIRLPEEAAEVVPTAVEAELESDIKSFATSEFDNPSPHVETLEFEEVDDEIWLRLRLGIAPSTFEDLDPDAIRHHALSKLEGMF